jgi:FAD synthase
MLLYKIRENIKFENLEQLKNQIKIDVNFAKKTNDYILTF